MITRIPVRIDVSKVENYLTSKSSRAENIDYPMTHLKKNYYPSSAANLHYELFSPVDRLDFSVEQSGTVPNYF